MSDTQGFDYLSLDGLVTEETKAWSGERGGLPPGDYLVKVTSVEKGQSSNQNPQVIVGFEVVDGEHRGRKMMSWYTLTKNAIGRLVSLLDAVGQKLDGKKGFSPQAMKGQELVIGVYEETGPGASNGMTGEKTEKTYSRVYRERPRSEWGAIKEKSAR